LNQAERSAFIKALFDEIKDLRPAPKLFDGLTVPAVEELRRLSLEQLHNLDRALSRVHGSHCPMCHPEMAWMPFAAPINGREYRRRQKAKQRRKR